MSVTVAALNRFPIKSCRGEALRSATVEPWGLQGDRRWMVVDENNEVITAREAHGLLRVVPEIIEDGVLLTGPDMAPLRVPTPHGTSLITVQVWDDAVAAAPAGEEADAWFAAVLGRVARLVYLDDPTRRPTNPRLTLPGDRVSFADGYPLLLSTEESLADLNDRIAEGPLRGQGPLPMVRFRPSLVVRGAPAWVEDDWRRVRIGTTVFRAVKGCDRCVLTTIDPETGARGKEPIATLARHRRWDGKTWFGINLVPDGQPGTITVGDELEVLSGVAPGHGPLR